MTTDTSLLAWVSIQPDLGSRQYEVYEAIRQLGTCTDKEIASHLGLPINTITPRRGELEKKFRLVVCDGIITQKNGRPAKTWRTLPKNY